MSSIARWTTPSILYKPSAVKMNTISEVILTVRQNGAVIIEKEKADAIESEDGYRWELSQQESATLTSGRQTILQIDYKCYDGMRYTTRPMSVDTLNSAKNEAI